MRRALLLLCPVLVFSLICPTAMAAQKKNFMPGADKNLPWQAQDFNKSIETGKPILLYVYDPIKMNSIAEDFEKEVLSSSDVKNAFSEFVPVKISTAERAWPPAYVQLGAKGAALVLITCDSKVLTVFGRGNMPKMVKDANKNKTYPDVVAAAQQTVQQNVKAKELVKKNPVPKFQQAGVAAVAAAAPEPEEKAKPMDGLLGNEDGKKDCKKSDLADAAKKEAAARKAELEKKKPTDESE